MKSKLPTILGMILLLAFLAAFIVWVRWEPWKIERVEWTPEEKALIVYRMKVVHGIQGAHPDGEGWYYFYNQKGQRCRL